MEVEHLFFGEPLRTVEALGTEAERTVRFRWHASGRMSHLILEDPATGEQVTEWEFGTTLETSEVVRNDLVVAKIYPTGESDSLTYDRQGVAASFTDPNGSVREFTYDGIGQLLDDAATTVGPGVDDELRRVSTRYDDRGQVDTVTTWDDPVAGQGTVLNQVQLVHGAFNQVVADRQAHGSRADWREARQMPRSGTRRASPPRGGGLVNTVDGSTPEVTTTYTDGSGNTSAAPPSPPPPAPRSPWATAPAAGSTTPSTVWRA